MKLLLAIVWPVLLAAQFRNGPQFYWPYVPEDVGISNYGQSAAATWLGVGFVATGNRTLSSVEIFMSSITGTPVSGDLRAALYNNSASGFFPGTEIEGINSASAPVANWNTVSGFTTTVTAWTQYWIVLRNMNATPASNFFTVQRRQSGMSGFGVMSNSVTGANGGWVSRNSTDSGTSWVSSTAAPVMIINWSDGTKEGFPLSGSSTTCQVYASRECGLHFQTGPLAIRAIGIVAMVTKTGTITGNFRLRLYEGTGASSRTLIDTSAVAIPNAQLSASMHYVFLPFSTTRVLRANTWYTLAASETTQSDASSNRINVAGYAIKSDAWQLISSHFASSPKYTLSTDGGSTWTDTNDQYHHMAVVVDPNQPFVMPSGGFAVTQ